MLINTNFPETGFEVGLNCNLNMARNKTHYESHAYKSGKPMEICGDSANTIRSIRKVHYFIFAKSTRTYRTLQYTCEDIWANLIDSFLQRFVPNSPTR
jgi:hypothetical protein